MMGRRGSFRLWQWHVDASKTFGSQEDSSFKSYLMLCVVISAVTLVAACRGQSSPRSVCFSTSPRGAMDTSFPSSGWNCTTKSNRMHTFLDGAPHVHVTLQNNNRPPRMENDAMPTMTTLSLDTSVAPVDIVLQGGWSTTNTLLHVFACSICIAMVVLQKTRAGCAVALAWSGVTLTFVVALVADVATLLSWKTDCALMGLMLAEEVGLSQDVASREILLKDISTACHAKTHLSFMVLFSATACLCLANAVFAIVRRRHNHGDQLATEKGPRHEVLV
ncbi:Aste57867_467 [Aphanomyces stellatus]|uniref:Aste57867_467 protein n=1 Tax=Aphanomyces stellatus TaxID=120398 RepID=A0A485K2Q3_9STRA|nr:hypothetical protein As57867_000466 [Aphanomyces stellatus]VFT77692.1 Aste57867_467 [Aphanomyces stellatus]